MFGNSQLHCAERKRSVVSTSAELNNYFILNWLNLGKDQCFNGSTSPNTQWKKIIFIDEAAPLIFVLNEYAISVHPRLFLLLPFNFYFSFSISICKWILNVGTAQIISLNDINYTMSLFYSLAGALVAWR